jgi:hypothetical protein
MNTRNTFSVIALGLLMAITGVTKAQVNKARVEVEVDPIAYLLNGYSFHLGYQLGKGKLDAAVFGLEVPEGVHNNKDFRYHNRGFGLNWIFLGNKPRGWYAGAGVGYSTKEFTHKETSLTQRISSLSVDIRAGYRIMFGKAEKQYKGFYLNPWIGLMYDLNAKDVSLGGDTFKNKHIGYFSNHTCRVAFLNYLGSVILLS